jgi:hypothetical protein
LRGELLTEQSLTEQSLTEQSLWMRARALAAERVPLPGAGCTMERFTQLRDVAREDVALAKIVEAHWDAVAILAEAGRAALPGQLYAVWASEVPGQGLQLGDGERAKTLSGVKPFATGGGLVDRALVTTGEPEFLLLDVDLVANRAAVRYDAAQWATEAFRATRTGKVSFNQARLETEAIGPSRWYVERVGLWHGACGVAACWVGAAQGLVDWAAQSRRGDPHTMAHLGAMQAAVWGMQAQLAQAASEIDAAPQDLLKARERALRLRHLVESACAEVLRRFGRAYGPYPLAMEPATARRYAETELFLRQSHAERDLEALGRMTLL